MMLTHAEAKAYARNAYLRYASRNSEFHEALNKDEQPFDPPIFYWRCHDGKDNKYYVYQTRMVVGVGRWVNLQPIPHSIPIEVLGNSAFWEMIAFEFEKDAIRCIAERQAFDEIPF